MRKRPTRRYRIGQNREPIKDVHHVRSPFYPGHQAKQAYARFVHATKRSAKKINGKMMYFGPGDDPSGALDRYRNYRNTGWMVSRRVSGKRVSKPEKPEGSPLFWLTSGRWAKKIRGKLFHFGRGSHDDAMAECESKKDALAGWTAPPRWSQTVSHHHVA